MRRARRALRPSAATKTVVAAGEVVALHAGAGKKLDGRVGKLCASFGWRLLDCGDHAAVDDAVAVAKAAVVFVSAALLKCTVNSAGMTDERRVLAELVRRLPNRVQPVVLEKSIASTSAWPGACGFYLAGELYVPMWDQGHLDKAKAKLFPKVMERIRFDSSAPQEHKDVFLSHDWSIHKDVVTVAEELRERKFRVWLDEYDMNGIVDKAMADGIEHAAVVLVFATKKYMDKVNSGSAADNCLKEFMYAADRKRGFLLPVAMEDFMLRTSNWTGIFKINLPYHLEEPFEMCSSTWKSKESMDRLAKLVSDRKDTKAMPKDLPAEMRDIWTRLRTTKYSWAQDNAKLFVEGTREWIFDAMEKWARTPPNEWNKMFVLLGQGGIGKTVVCAEFARRHGAFGPLCTSALTEPPSGRRSLRQRLRQSLLGHMRSAPGSSLSAGSVPVAAYHFFQHNIDGASDAKDAIRSVAWQLVESIDGFAAALGDVTADMVSDTKSINDLFEALVAEPAKRVVSPPSRALVVFDALDECKAEHRHELVRSLARWGYLSTCNWLGFVLSSRREAYIPPTFEDFGPTELMAGSEHNRADVRMFLTKKLAPLVIDGELAAAVELLTERSEGLFVFLELVLADLRRVSSDHKLTVDELKSDKLLPPSLSFVYLNYFARLKKALGDNNHYKALLSVVVAAREPLTKAQLGRLLGLAEDETEQTVLKAQNLLHVGQDGTVTLLHKTMADWLTDWKSTDAAVKKKGMLAVMEGLHADPSDGHFRLGEWLKKEREDRFAFAHSVYHLAQSGQREAAMALLHDFDWLLTALADKNVGAWSLVRDAPDSDDEVVLALQKSLHALRERPLELAFQLLGRLGTDHPMRKDIDQVMKARGVRWMRPIAANLASAKGALQMILQGHRHNVSSVAFSPDGQRIVSGSWDETVRVWSAETGEQLHDMRGHTSFVNSVAFSPDGQRIVSGSQDKTVRVWSAETGEQLYEMRGHTYWVTSVAFSPDGQRIVSGSDDTTVRVWSADTGKQLHRMRGHTLFVRSVAFAPDGQRIVSGSCDETVRVWSAQTGEQLREMRSHTSYVNSVAFSPDGQRIVSGSEDTTVRVWSAQTGEQLHELRGHTSYVTSVAFSPDGKRIVSGSRDNTVRVWSAQTGEQLHEMWEHGDGVWSVAFSPDGQRIVFGSTDMTVRVWSLETGEQFLDGQRFEKRGHADYLTAFYSSPDGKRVVLVRENHALRVCLIETGEQLHEMRGHTSSVNSVAFSPDGQRIVSGSWDMTVRVWSAETGEQLHDIRGHTEGVWSVAFSPDGQRIVSGSYDKTVRVWSAETGEQLHEIRGHTECVWSVAFSPDGQRIVSDSEDKTVRVWSAETGEQLHEIRGHEDGGFSVAFSPDGQCIVSGSGDKTMRVWSALTGEQLHEIRGHEDGVWSVAFSPDGQHIMSSGDETVRVWSTTTGEQVQVIRGTARAAEAARNLARGRTPVTKYIAQLMQEGTVGATFDGPVYDFSYHNNCVTGVSGGSFFRITIE